jgi:hypothetical protein
LRTTENPLDAKFRESAFRALGWMGVRKGTAYRGSPSTSNSEYSLSLYSPTTDSTSSLTVSTDSPFQMHTPVVWSGGGRVDGQRHALRQARLQRTVNRGMKKGRDVANRKAGPPFLGGGKSGEPGLNLSRL